LAEGSGKGMADQPTSIFIGASLGGTHPQALQLPRANRHGLIAGAPHPLLL